MKAKPQDIFKTDPDRPAEHETSAPAGIARELKALAARMQLSVDPFAATMPHPIGRDTFSDSLIDESMPAENFLG